MTFLAIEVSEVNLHKVNVDGSYKQRQQKIVVMVIELKFVYQISPFVYLKVACIFYVHALLLTGVRL